MIESELNSDDLLIRHRTALIQQQGLQRKITAALQAPNDELAIRDALESMQTDVDGLETFFRTITLSQLYNEQRPPNAKDVAQKVFEIPEILEMILMKLEPVSLLVVMQTNPLFRDSVLASVKLQRRLSLLPDNDCHFDTLPAGHVMPGFKCRLYTTVRGLMADEEVLNVEFHRKLKLGARSRAMGFCQPPLTEMKVYINCCAAHASARPFLPKPALRTVRTEAGLTIGDLYDEHERMLKEHRNCPHAHWTQYAEDGTVRVHVVFTATFKRKLNDPHLARRQQAQEEASEKTLKQEAWKSKIQALCAAKQLGTS